MLPREYHQTIFYSGARSLDPDVRVFRTVKKAVRGCWLGITLESSLSVLRTNGSSTLFLEVLRFRALEASPWRSGKLLEVYALSTNSAFDAKPVASPPAFPCRPSWRA